MLQLYAILRYFAPLYFPFAPLCAPLRYFTLLYSTLLYLGTSPPACMRVWHIENQLSDDKNQNLACVC